MNFMISGAMRKSSPLIVVGLGVLLLAFVFSTVGITKNNKLTVVGAIMYAIAGEQEILHHVHSYLNERKTIFYILLAGRPGVARVKYLHPAQAFHL